MRPVPVDPTGRAGPTRGAAAGPHWRVTTRGLYVPSSTDSRVPEQRVLEQSMRLPPGGAVSGWAGLRLHGASFFDGLERDGATPRPVPLALGPAGRLRAGPAVRLLYERVDADDLTVRQGVPVTTAVRCAFDAVRLAEDEWEAVVVVDMAAAAGLVSLARLRAYVRVRPGWMRITVARRALELATEHSRSPQETRLRLVWLLVARLPAVLVNCPVRSRDDGRLLAVADLLDEEAGLVVEYDGADHRGALRHTRDVDREERLRAHGLEVCRVTGIGLRDVSGTASRLRAARERARWLAPADRRWYADPPADILEQELQRAEALAAAREELWGQPLPTPEEMAAW